MKVFRRRLLRSPFSFGDDWVSSNRRKILDRRERRERPQRTPRTTVLLFALSPATHSLMETSNLRTRRRSHSSDLTSHFQGTMVNSRTSMNIVKATSRYEDWLKSHTAVVEAD